MENKQAAVIGLGYVGLPLAVALSKKHSVIGYDINGKKLNLLKNLKMKLVKLLHHNSKIVKI